MSVNTSYNNGLPYLSDCNNSTPVNQNNTINETKQKTSRISYLVNFIFTNSFFACIGSASAGFLYGFTIHNVLIGATVGIIALNVALITLSLIILSVAQIALSLIILAGTIYIYASRYRLPRHS